MVNAAIGLALALAATGCTFLDVQADLPEVCMTHRDIDVEGVPVELAGSIDKTFAFDDLSAFDAIKDLEAEARFVRATVRATAGVDSLAFVEAASVEIASNTPSSTLPARVVYACDGDCPAEDNALLIPALEEFDALADIRSGSLSIGLAARGAMPTDPWTMDVELCVAASASYKYQP